ncbi:MAG: DUF5329 family protein [Bacteriovoracaceae bacterium]
MRTISIFNMLEAIFFMICLSFAQAVMAQDSTNEAIEEKKIDYLLREVAKSGAIFIRNGSEHDAQKASEHLRNKMEGARKRFRWFGKKRAMSAKEFIEKIASESSMSGKAYQMRLKSGEVLKTQDWLFQKLESFSKKPEVIKASTNTPKTQ